MFWNCCTNFLATHLFLWHKIFIWKKLNKISLKTLRCELFVNASFSQLKDWLEREGDYVYSLCFKHERLILWKKGLWLRDMSLASKSLSTVSHSTFHFNYRVAYILINFPHQQLKLKLKCLCYFFFFSQMLVKTYFTYEFVSWIYKIVCFQDNSWLCPSWM